VDDRGDLADGVALRRKVGLNASQAICETSRSTIGFGRISVSSASRVPTPPASMATFISLNSGTGRLIGSKGCQKHAGRYFSISVSAIFSAITA
jgi:hypothetical protein